MTLGFRLQAFWSAPSSLVDISSLVFFRIAFGLVAFLHIWLQIVQRRPARYAQPEMFFSYPGLDWIKPLPCEWMYLLFFALAAAAICISLGFYYRWATIFFFTGHTFELLVDQSNYWNHYYLISLFAFLLIFVPVHRAFSLDIARGAVPRSDTAPAWCLWVLCGQMAIAYFFAGLAKLSPDWLDGRPMDYFLEENTSFPLVGRYFTQQWLAPLFSRAGAAFDLLIVPFLLWPATRWGALAAAIAFHLTNSLLFPIEIFPWLAISATLLFLGPSWPRFGGQRLHLPYTSYPSADAPSQPTSQRVSLTNAQKASAALLLLYFAFQVFLPLRHLLYPGNAEWTSEGHFFAWRMLLSSTRNDLDVFVKDKATGLVCEERQQEHLGSWQIRQMADRPDMMIQFAHYLADHYRRTEGKEIEVYVQHRSAFNGREIRPLVPPDVNLASEKRTIGHIDWLLPLDGPAAPRPERLPDCQV